MKKLITLSALLLCFTGLRAMDVRENTETVESQEEYVFDPALRVLPIDPDTVVAFRRELQASEATRGTYQKAVGALGAAVLLWGAYRWYTDADAKSALGGRIYDIAEQSVKLEEMRVKLGKEEYEKVKKKMEEDEKAASEKSAQGGQPVVVDASVGGVVPAPAPASAPDPSSPATPEQKKKEDIDVTVGPDGKVNKAQLEDFMRSLIDPTTRVIPKDLGWGEWLVGGIKGMGGWALWLPVIFVKSRIAHEVGRFVFGYFPYPGQAVDYLFKARSLHWCLNDHTEFYTAAIGLKNLSVQLKAVGDGKAILHEKDISKIKAYVWQADEIFAREMEKVLGYMQYIIAQIDPQDEIIRNRRMRDIGMASLGLLIEKVDELVEDTNAFLQSNVSVADCRSFSRNIEDRLFGVICHLESFESVVSTVGIADLDPRDRFAFWKEFVKPGLLPHSPKRQEDKIKAEEGQRMKEILETAVDWKEVVGL